MSQAANMHMRLRLRAIIRILLGLAVIAITYWWYWRSHPHVQFPVERLDSSGGSPVFSLDDESSEGRYAIAFAVRSVTWRPIQRVIIDYRFDEFGESYAFTGKTSGMAFTLGHGGIDTATIVAESRWDGDPRSFILRQEGEIPARR